jgi:hypothetical protein
MPASDAALAARRSFVFGLNRELTHGVHHLEGTKLLYPAALHVCILDTATDQASAAASTPISVGAAAGAASDAPELKPHRTRCATQNCRCGAGNGAARQRRRAGPAGPGRCALSQIFRSHRGPGGEAAGRGALAEWY